MKQAVVWALEAGYRHIDCATIYGNEVEIGEALQDTLGTGKVKQPNIEELRKHSAPKSVFFPVKQNNNISFERYSDFSVQPGLVLSLVMTFQDNHNPAINLLPQLYPTCCVCAPGPETRGRVHHIQAVEHKASPRGRGAGSLEDPKGPEAGVPGPLPHPLALRLPVSSASNNTEMTSWLSTKTTCCFLKITS